MKTELEQLDDEMARCLAAFRQGPTPRLAATLKQIHNAKKPQVLLIPVHMEVARLADSAASSGHPIAGSRPTKCKSLTAA